MEESPFSKQLEAGVFYIIVAYLKIIAAGGACIGLLKNELILAIEQNKTLRGKLQYTHEAAKSFNVNQQQLQAERLRSFRNKPWYKREASPFCCQSVFI